MPGLLVHSVYCPDAQLQDLGTLKGSSLIKHQHLMASKGFFFSIVRVLNTHMALLTISTTLRQNLPCLGDTHCKYKTGFGFCC